MSRTSIADTEDPALTMAFAVSAGDDRPTTGAEFDLVVADASWSWTERLFSPLAGLGARVLLIKACDWRTALHQRRPASDWLNPRRRLGPGLWEHRFVLPPGWMKTYPSLGMRPIARAVRHWRGTLPGARPLVLAISYPHYLALRDQVRPDGLIYYNMDDYSLYWERRAHSIRRLERAAVAQANLSAFCARTRADELRRAVPEAAPRIVHLPHGAPAHALAPYPLRGPAEPPPDLAALPRPRLGFVGSLEDRVDWRIVADLAEAFPAGSIALVGREPAPAPRHAWYADYRRATALPNVHRLGWKSQEAVGRYASAFDVCLIPYLAGHRFNRAACPTKIMDYMATSRPIVATDVPECRLYADLFDVADSREAFVAAVRRIVAGGCEDDRAADRWERARASTWEHTAERLLGHYRRTAG
jgi:teichuronic acid biosynthesis glycosyltransferase TuaH